MDKGEYEEENKRLEISDIEITKLRSVFDRALIFMHKSALQLINGNKGSFVDGMILVELTLLPKLVENKPYNENLRKKRVELKSEELSDFDEKYEIALFKFGEINTFLDMQTPLLVHTSI